jgi:Conserved hypothetical ATP binding protein
MSEQIFRHADPAAEAFQYDVTCDVRDLITLEDVMEELELGPNGFALCQSMSIASLMLYHAPEAACAQYNVSSTVCHKL